VRDIVWEYELLTTLATAYNQIFFVNLALRYSPATDTVFKCSLQQLLRFHYLHDTGTNMNLIHIHHG
jgi:hypothetical protein